MRTLVEIVDILNKNIIGVVGLKKRKNSASIPAEYILLNDRETYIALEEQDYYSYHDCSTHARELTIIKDKERWDALLNHPDYGTTTETTL